jgi:hypothetical protein
MSAAEQVKSVNEFLFQIRVSHVRDRFPDCFHTFAIDSSLAFTRSRVHSFHSANGLYLT